MMFHKKLLISSKPLPIRFNKIDGLIRIYDGSRYLVLFGIENYNAFQNMFFLTITRKSKPITSSLHIEITLTLRNVITHSQFSINII